MRRVPRALIPAFSIATLVIAPVPCALASGFAASSQARSVEVEITQTTLACITPQSCSVIGTSTQSDSESAPDFTPFVATAIVPPFTQTSADQDSSLGATRIEARGSSEATGSGGLSTPPNIFTVTDSEAASRFSTTFTVAAATPYRLSGSVTSSGGLSANSISFVRLKTSGGAVIAEVSAATDPNCQEAGCAEVGPNPLISVGVLAPGSYVLEAEASGQAAPFFFAGNFFGLTSTGQYDFVLAVTDVPALSPAALALLGLALGFTALAAQIAREGRGDQRRAR
jgi:hypothetical protein